MEFCENSESIIRGCHYDCLYCSSAAKADEFNHRRRDQWKNEVYIDLRLSPDYEKENSSVVFPRNHDITPDNLQECLAFMKLILQKNNRLLILSKPNVYCVSEMVKELLPWRDQILFRFTIGTSDNEVSSIWEPHAPLVTERIEALEIAYLAGFRTSVSAEPLLGGMITAAILHQAVRPFITNYLWFGLMKKTKLRIKTDSPKVKEALNTINHYQQDRYVLELYAAFKDLPEVQWKDSIREVITRYGYEDTLRHP